MQTDANQISIIFIAAYPNLLLKIEDNGSRYNKDLAHFTGNDRRTEIRGIKERVSLLKGDINIIAKEKTGSKISIAIPFKESCYNISKSSDTIQ